MKYSKWIQKSTLWTMSQFHLSWGGISIMIIYSRLRSKLNINQEHHLLERLAFIRTAPNAAVTRHFFSRTPVPSTTPQLTGHVRNTPSSPLIQSLHRGGLCTVPCCSCQGDPEKRNQGDKYRCAGRDGFTELAHVIMAGYIPHSAVFKVEAQESWWYCSKA